MADLIDTVVGPRGDHLPHARIFGRPTASPRCASAIRPRVPGRFYLRFNVDDRPGVMAEITGILGRHGISIASVIQHETEEDACERRAAGDHDPHHDRRRAWPPP